MQTDTEHTPHVDTLAVRSKATGQQDTETEERPSVALAILWSMSASHKITMILFALNLGVLLGAVGWAIILYCMINLNA